MSAPNLLRPLSADEPIISDEDRLAPDVLRRDAEWLLNHNEDLVALLVSLLRTIRENHTQQEAIRDGYGFSCRQLEEQLREVCDERNSMREAIRAVNRATRGIKVGRW